MQRSWKYLFYKPSYSPFCLKFRCHGNRGRSRVNTRKGDAEGKNRFAAAKREGEVTTIRQHCCLCSRGGTLLLLWHHAGATALWVIMYTDGQKKQLLNLYQCLLCSP